MFDYFVQEYKTLCKEFFKADKKKSEAKQQVKRCDTIHKMLTDKKFNLDSDTAIDWLIECCKRQIAALPWWVTLLKYIVTAGLPLMTAYFGLHEDNLINGLFSLINRLLQGDATLTHTTEIITLAATAVEYALLRTLFEDAAKHRGKKIYENLLADLRYYQVTPQAARTQNKKTTKA